MYTLATLSQRDGPASDPGSPIAAREPSVWSTRSLANFKREQRQVDRRTAPSVYMRLHIPPLITMTR